MASPLYMTQGEETRGGVDNEWVERTEDEVMANR